MPNDSAQFFPMTPLLSGDCEGRERIRPRNWAFLWKDPKIGSNLVRPLPMDTEHIKLQYDRLGRHHSAALKDKDPISFLDLSHALRIWVDMKSSVDALAAAK